MIFLQKSFPNYRFPPTATATIMILSLNPCYASRPPIPTTKPFIRLRANPYLYSNLYQDDVKVKVRLRRGGICRAEFLHVDSPFAIAIGASMLSSFLFPNTTTTINGGYASEEHNEDDEGAVMGPTDIRFAVMTIISFIPYFNWLSWVFALMETGNRRYAVYAIVYLAPYFRSNLSLSPEESWLPIASIVLCIAHIQLESSIRNRELSSSSTSARKDDHRNRRRLLSHDDEHKLGDEMQNWGMPERPFQEPEYINKEDEADNEEG